MRQERILSASLESLCRLIDFDDLRGFVHGELGKGICCSWDAAKWVLKGLHRGYLFSFVAAAAQCFPTTLKGMVWTGCCGWVFGSCLHFFVPWFLLSWGSNGYSLQGIKKKAFRILSGVFSSCVRTKGMDNPSPCQFYFNSFLICR